MHILRHETWLCQLGHEVFVVGVRDDLLVIRNAVDDWKPHLAFNLLEEFSGVAIYDQTVASYLELLGVPYTGCNPRGLMLASDGAGKEDPALSPDHHSGIYHGAGRPLGEAPQRIAFPLCVKSGSEKASLGISQASIAEDDGKLEERVAFIHQSIGTAALIERYIDGRELYVGVLGNRRAQIFPVWDLNLSNMPEAAKRIATERVK